uniref:RRM domain-containing protein n=1 Tax=Lutzomyia longipalpis TaxID=7200 RepID=A0A1B0CNS1_LUTLO
MKMSKLSNQTNSQDPQAVNSRIFVGNLNTFQCSKTDVERMFQRYGRLAENIKMKMSKLSNQTNSQDPQAVNSRIFVGNLNTFQCSKTDVERMFQRYGRLAGISMHKGYAFVQFTNPFDARNACHGEDGRTVLSQTLDVNMVAEPKPHQIGRKRQNVTKTGNDW